MLLREGMKKLQEANPEYLILVRNGIFYHVIGKDAFYLEKKYGLVRTCFGKGCCKCGILANQIEEFLQKLEQKQDSYILYDYVPGKKLKWENQFKELKRYRGKEINQKELEPDCENCSKNRSFTKVEHLSEKKLLENSNRKLTEQEKMLVHFVKSYLDELLEKYIKGEL